MKYSITQEINKFAENRKERQRKFGQLNSLTANVRKTRASLSSNYIYSLKRTLSPKTIIF